MLCCLSFDLRSSIFIIFPGFVKPLEPSEDIALYVFSVSVLQAGKINMYTSKGQRCVDAENLFDVLKSAISLHDYFFVVVCLTVFACHRAVCCLFKSFTRVGPFISVHTMVRLAVPCQRCRVTHLCLQLGKHVNNSNLCAYVCVSVCVHVCPPTQGSYSSTVFVMSGSST